MQSWGLTDQGCVRKQNQDAYQIEQLDKNSVLCVVCDGMGGAKSGNVASSLAADTFAQEMKRTWKGRRKSTPEQLLFEAVNLANDTVYQQSKVSEEYTGMGTTLVEGDFISIDGSTGAIYDGIIPTVDAEISGNFGTIMGWADEFRTLKVRTNADTPADAKKARELGAEGIGLCRTEHMFFEAERIAAFREMICSDTAAEREKALNKILPYQQSDFEALYEALEGTPVCIRFLDPPFFSMFPH